MHLLNRTLELVLLPILATIVFVQEIVLGFLPNITLTPLLLMLYTRLLGFGRTVIILILYITFDILYMPVNPIFIPFLFLGWFVIPLLMRTAFKECHSVYFLSLFAFCHGFLYGWILLPAGLILTELPFWAYLVQDLPFEIIMAISSSSAVFVAYEPLYRRLKPLFDQLLSG